jgi:hypothetical protein
MALTAALPTEGMALPPQSSTDVRSVPITPTRTSSDPRFVPRSWRIVSAPYQADQSKMPAALGSCTDGWNPTTGHCN